jgi:zinc protease
MESLALKLFSRRPSADILLMHRLLDPYPLALAASLVLALGGFSDLHAQTQAAAATGAARQVAVTEPEQFTLANGMTLIVKPDRRAPTAALMLWVRVGSMDEVDGTTGVAHVLEHMLFKGTPTLKPGEFSKRIAALGGRDNAFTSRDATAYHQQIPSSRLEEVMQLDADRIAHSQWSDDEFRRELEVVKEERRLRVEDAPRAQLYEAANAVMFTSAPYRRPIIGWMSDLESLTSDDARDFYKRWYQPANLALVVAGDVDVAKVRQLAETYYGRIPAGGALPARKPRAEPEQSGLRRVEHKAPASQAYVSLMFKVPQLQAAALLAAPGGASASGPSRDALALTVLAAVLDGYTGARLDRALTQGPARLADSAGASNGLYGRGPQVFVLDGVPADGQTAEQLATALREQVAQVAREGVSEAELNRVKTQWVASETYKLDAVFSQARELGSHWVRGFPLDASRRLVAHLRTVTSAEVQHVAAHYFGADQLTMATLVPQPRDPQAKPRTAQTSLRH